MDRTTKGDQEVKAVLVEDNFLYTRLKIYSQNI